MSATDPVVLELAALKNLGEKTAIWLVDAGVRSRSEMAKLGAIEVCRRMLLAGHPVSLVAAYAIEGALTDTHWNHIPPQKRLEVQRLFAVMKRGIAAGPPVVKAGARPAAKAASESAAAPAKAETPAEEPVPAAKKSAAKAPSSPEASPSVKASPESSTKTSAKPAAKTPAKAASKPAAKAPGKATAKAAAKTVRRKS